MSTDFYGVESAVIGFAMVGALGNGALNSSVGFHIRHFASSFHDEKEFRDLLNPGIIISVRHAFDSYFHRFSITYGVRVMKYDDGRAFSKSNV